MDPATLALLSSIPQIALGAVGEGMAAGDDEEADRLYRQNLGDYEGLTLPELRALQAEQLGGSAMEGIQADPTARAAQYEALNELQRIARSGGATLQDKATLSRLNQEGARNASAGNARIAAEMQARGQYGGGQQLAMQMANQQASAQRSANAGLDQAAQAQRRGMDAILEGGRLGGAIRGQGFDEQSRVAQAKDMVSRYNADARAGAARYNAQLPQQQFQNQMAVTAQKGQARGDLAQRAREKAEGKRKFWGGAGSAGTSMLRGAIPTGGK